MAHAKKTCQGKLVAVTLCCIALVCLASAGCGPVHQLYPGPKRPSEETAALKIRWFRLTSVYTNASQESKAAETILIPIKDRPGQMECIFVDKAWCYCFVKAVDGQPVPQYDTPRPRPHRQVVYGAVGDLLYKDSEQFSLLPGLHRTVVQIYIGSSAGSYYVACWMDPLEVEFNARPGRSYLLRPKAAYLGRPLTGWSVEFVDEDEAKDTSKVSSPKELNVP